MEFYMTDIGLRETLEEKKSASLEVSRIQSG
jgi:hypothetical protein